MGRLELEKERRISKAASTAWSIWGTWAAAEEGVCACAAVPVKMSAYVTRELILLACSIWQGAVLGFWYDLSDQDSAETDPPQPCGGICRGPLLLDCGSAVSVCTDLRREQRHSPRVSVWRHPWGRCIVPRIVWTLSSGTSGKGNQKSRANPRFSRKMAGKKYEKTEKKVEISWEER